MDTKESEQIIAIAVREVSILKKAIEDAIRIIDHRGSTDLHLVTNAVERRLQRGLREATHEPE